MLNHNGWWMTDDWVQLDSRSAEKVRVARHIDDTKLAGAWSYSDNFKIKPCLFSSVSSEISATLLSEITVDLAYPHVWDMCEAASEETVRKEARLFYPVNNNLTHHCVNNTLYTIDNPQYYYRWDDGIKAPVKVDLDYVWNFSSISCAPGPSSQIVIPKNPTWVPPVYSKEEWQRPKYEKYYWVKSLYDRYTRVKPKWVLRNKERNKYNRYTWIPTIWQLPVMEGYTPGEIGIYTWSSRTSSQTLVTIGPIGFNFSVYGYVPGISFSDAQKKAIVNQRRVDYGEPPMVSWTYFSCNVIQRTDGYGNVYYQFYGTYSGTVYQTTYGPWVNRGTVNSWTLPPGTLTEQYSWVKSPIFEKWTKLGVRNASSDVSKYASYRATADIQEVVSETPPLLWPGQNRWVKSGTGIWGTPTIYSAYSAPADTATVKYELIYVGQWVDATTGNPPQPVYTYSDTEPEQPSTYQKYFKVEDEYWKFVSTVSIDNPIDTANTKYVLKTPGYWSFISIINWGYSYPPPEVTTPPADPNSYKYVLVQEGYWLATGTTVSTDTPPADTTTTRYVKIAEGYWNRTYNPPYVPICYYVQVGGSLRAIIDNSNGILRFQPNTPWHRNYSYNRTSRATVTSRAGLDAYPIDNYPMDEGYRTFPNFFGNMASSPIDGKTFLYITPTDIGFCNTMGGFTSYGNHNLPVVTVHRGCPGGWFLVTSPDGVLSVVKINTTTLLVEKKLEVFYGFSGHTDHADFGVTSRHLVIVVINEASGNTPQYLSLDLTTV